VATFLETGFAFYAHKGLAMKNAVWELIFEVFVSIIILRSGSCGPSRMTWGQVHWLYLSCVNFPFHCFLPVIWRFYPADKPLSTVVF
jgi:hypothetical protein